MFTLTIHGKGGHGATPHDTIDATFVACQLVVALQSIVARNTNPSDTAVVTVGSFHSGNAGNVISERAVLEGTIRSFEPEVRSLLLQRIDEICAGICQAMGARFEFNLQNCVPPTSNSEAGAQLMEGIANDVVGAQNVTQIPPMMVGEDMAEFSEPGARLLRFGRRGQPGQGVLQPAPQPHV